MERDTQRTMLWMCTKKKVDKHTPIFSQLLGKLRQLDGWHCFKKYFTCSTWSNRPDSWLNVFRLNMFSAFTILATLSHYYTGCHISSLKQIIFLLSNYSKTLSLLLFILIGTKVMFDIWITFKPFSIWAIYNWTWNFCHHFSTNSYQLCSHNWIDIYVSEMVVSFMTWKTQSKCTK